MVFTWLLIISAFGIAAAIIFRSKPQLEVAHQKTQGEPSSSSESTFEKSNATASNNNANNEKEKNQMNPHLPDHITAWDHDTIERGRWCERVLEHIYQERHDGRYNVLGINTALEYYVNLDGIVEEFELLYKSKKGRLVYYRYVVFEKGEVLNLGDGGGINWVWSGTYTRPGVDMISFQKRDK